MVGPKTSTAFGQHNISIVRNGYGNCILHTSTNTDAKSYGYSALFYIVYIWHIDWISLVLVSYAQTRTTCSQRTTTSSAAIIRSRRDFAFTPEQSLIAGTIQTFLFEGWHLHLMSKAGNVPYLVRWSILSVLSLQTVGSIPRSHQGFVQALA